MSSYQQNAYGVPVLDVFTANHFPLTPDDNLESIAMAAFNVKSIDPSGQRAPLILQVSTIKNPMSPYILNIYFRQLDESGYQIAAEFLDVTQSVQVCATLHDEMNLVISSLGPYLLNDEADRQQFMTEIRRVYSAMPFILKG